MKIYKQYEELRDASLDLSKAVDELTKRLRIAYDTIEKCDEMLILNMNEAEMYSEMIDDLKRNNANLDVMGVYKKYHDHYDYLGDSLKKSQLYKGIFANRDILSSPMKV